MTDEMKILIEKRKEASKTVSKIYDELRRVCDHQDEVGSWARTYDGDTWRCEYCGEPM